MPDPLDLARWRALAEASLRELPQCSECDGGWEPQPDGMHRWWIGEGETRMVLSQFQCPQHPQAALSTALRAACDEVERLRAEVASWQRYKAQLDEAFNSGDGSYRP